MLKVIKIRTTSKPSELILNLLFIYDFFNDANVCARHARYRFINANIDRLSRGANPLWQVGLSLLVNGRASLKLQIE